MSTNNKEIKEFAKTFVVRFFQRTASFKERIDILNKAIKLAGINATYHQEHRYGGKAYFNVHTEDDFDRAEQFKNELLGCHPLGQYEWEVNAVVKTIEKYRG